MKVVAVATAARWTSPIVWARPRRMAKKLAAFAAVEAESALELHAAATKSPDPVRRAAYLRHALDEQRHARIFRRAAGDIAADLGGAPHVTAEALFERLGEARFLAFVHRGEQRGRAQFEAYRDHFAARDARTSAMFAAIVVDERRHESYTRALLVEVCGGEARARAELRRAAAWEAWRLWRRMGRAVAQLVFFVLMMAMYAAVAPFALLLRHSPAPPSGWRR